AKVGLHRHRQRPPRRQCREAGGDAAAHGRAMQAAEQAGDEGGGQGGQVQRHGAQASSRGSAGGLAVAGGGAGLSSSSRMSSAGVSRSSNWPRLTAQTKAATAKPSSNRLSGTSNSRMLIVRPPAAVRWGKRW